MFILICNPYLHLEVMSLSTQRLSPKRQTLEDAYSPPANFLEIDVRNPSSEAEGKNRFIAYEVHLKVS